MANMLTSTELSKILKCRRSTLVLMAEAGSIPAIDVSVSCRPSYRFNLAKVEEALAVRAKPAASKRFMGFEEPFLV